VNGYLIFDNRLSASIRTTRRVQEIVCVLALTVNSAHGARLEVEVTVNSQEIRRVFREYFVRKGHAPVDSSSLIPGDDPTLLFVNAGMVQFKDCFLGTQKRNYSRAVTCQKCLRISGKHNDLENVGRTPRHHTFFEMLGNFSFGDYFKQDAILFAWEFLTQEMGLDKSRLWVTVFEDDDEAGRLWQKHTDVLPGRVLTCGAKENFWAMGDTGPCGPCSELHYYIGNNPESQCEADFRADAGDYLEVWNLVFMQFSRDIHGKLSPLPAPSVDTGMGLERISAISQGVVANYDTDVLRALIAKAEKLSGHSYDGRDYSKAQSPAAESQDALDVAFRVIADHARACAFLIADGVSPSSDGRGYVLRRLVRRACRHGRVLGLRRPFLFEIAGEVVSCMKEDYPELSRSQARILSLIEAEESRFIETLDTGMTILAREMESLCDTGSKILSGKVAFSLHDTYGFPLDLTQDIVRTQGLKVDEEGFHSEMESQRERSRSVRAQGFDQHLSRAVRPMRTKFVGYDNLEYESEVLGIFGLSGELDRVGEGEDVAIVVSETPFYAESGGQLGDTGAISSQSASLIVLDTQKAAGDTIVHICRVSEGDLGKADRVRLAVSAARRSQLRVHHSATHLVNQALKEIVGEHVRQAGSRVSDRDLRFDFNHHHALTDVQISEIESRVNALIRENHSVVTEVMELEAARKSGAAALFGEKYGSEVRVVRIGPGSLELCGGTHVSRSGDIGFISLKQESAISAGVRRIEVFAGRSAADNLRDQKTLLRLLSSSLNVGQDGIAERLMRLLERNRDLEHQLGKASEQISRKSSGDLAAQAEEVGHGAKLVVASLADADPKSMRSMVDDLKARLGKCCIGLFAEKDGKLLVAIGVSGDLTDRLKAGTLIRDIGPIIGCKGGGRDDLAQAGGGDVSKATQAIAEFRRLVLLGL